MIQNTIHNPKRNFIGKPSLNKIFVSVQNEPKKQIKIIINKMKIKNKKTNGDVATDKTKARIAKIIVFGGIFAIVLFVILQFVLATANNRQETQIPRAISIEEDEEQMKGIILSKKAFFKNQNSTIIGGFGLLDENESEIAKLQIKENIEASEDLDICLAKIEKGDLKSCKVF